MESFLPAGYDRIPSSSRYMKLQDGENTFRVLSSAITGWEYWNTLNKVVRSKGRWEEIPHDIRIESDGKQSKVKHFWAFVVWNYEEKMIQVLEVTQAQIMNAVKGLVDSKHWGDPKNYDISISRSGTGFDTEYVVQGIPPQPLDPKILVEYKKTNVDLAALYTNGDPFGAVAKAGAAIDDPPYEEPTINVDEPAAKPDVPERLKTVPEKFRSKVA
jgi:hypothetical protein